jgi:pilus assembly protein CpaF
MTSEPKQPANQPYLLPHQAEENDTTWEAQPDGASPALQEGVVRRARLRLFPEAGSGPAYTAPANASWQSNWVVDSQIVETTDFGSEEPYLRLVTQDAEPSIDLEQDDSVTLAPSAFQSALEPVFQPEEAAPLYQPPAYVPEPYPVAQPPIEEVAPAPLLPSVPPATALRPASSAVPASVPAAALELPDSAFRKLTPLEAQYIGVMRSWLKEESGKPGSPLPQLAPDEQVQLALEALNQELSRKLQSRLPASFASVAQAYLFGWGPLDHLMRLEDVTEVMVNGSVSLFIECRGKLEAVGPGLDDETIYTIAERMTGSRPTLAEPMIDERIKDGSRLNATHASVSMLGATLSIRRFPQVALTADDLVRTEAITPEVLRFLEILVRGRMNMVISGGTNTGKTTLLNVLLGAIPPTQRLIIIEQAPAEIRCNLPNRGHLLTRPRTADGAAEVSVAALVRNALRMRPDRIVVGECRGGEALAMMQAMNTGHAGSLTTLHANHPFDALARLETMVLMAESGLPHDAIRAQIARAIQIIVQTRRDPNGRRYVSEVVQVAPSSDSTSGYACSTLFEARQEHGRMVCRRTRASLDQSLQEQMLSYGVRAEELQTVAAPGPAR